LHLLIFFAHSELGTTQHLALASVILHGVRFDAIYYPTFQPHNFCTFFSNRLGNFIYHTAVALYDFLFWSHFFSTRFSALAGHRTRFSSTSFSTVITLEMPPTFSSRDVTIGVRALVFDPFIHLMTQCSTLLFHQDQSSFTPNTTIYPQPYHPPTTLPSTHNTFQPINLFSQFISFTINHLYHHVIFTIQYVVDVFHIFNGCYSCHNIYCFFIDIIATAPVICC